MASHQQEAEEFGGRTVPPATPPPINRNASAEDAAHAPADGDSDFPGQRPDEVGPSQGDFDQPDRSPEQEVPDRGGDVVQPGESPQEQPVPIEPSVAPPPD